ncbi:ribonuclease T [Parahalioglobus pacificus]|uniref:Ribonuclease T n=1 Tax=Parahalioglobus pacificus TaxID=930806 RepID=A0A918XL68_9GAMM|nr:ribonuclease T [Halioglobus pacificus]NQY02693.1 ribonuclease T [Halieaceae bacterium]GHD37440.1 ribonuclease T [Halioglobus pacificus]
MLDTEHRMADRFRGFLPVVVDVETGGFVSATDAILEIAATLIRMDEDGRLNVHRTLNFNIKPFEGANIEQAALDFTGIDPHHPFREAVDEEEALGELFRAIRKEIRDQGCNRAILVGHNAHFDAGFVNAAVERCGIKRNPFHPFSHFDTATLSGLAYGQTVLAKACGEAGIAFDNSEAHSAAYDAERTAELFCEIVNRWKDSGGWMPAFED